MEHVRHFRPSLEMVNSGQPRQLARLVAGSEVAGQGSQGRPVPLDTEPALHTAQDSAPVLEPLPTGQLTHAEAFMAPSKG